MFNISLVSVATLVITVTLAAQEATSLRPGERVRVHFVSSAVNLDAPNIPGFHLGGRLEGSYLATTLDTALIRATNDTTTFAVPLSLVSHIEVQRGRQSNGLKAGKFGTVVGGVVGLFGFASSCKEGFAGVPECDPTWLLAPVGGGVLGYGIGSLSHSEKWEAVPLTSLRVAPLSLHRIAVTVSLVGP